MKSIGKIRYKLRQVRHRLLQKAIRNGLSKKPCNCKNSGLVRGASSEPIFYVCLLDADRPREWEGTICDPSVPNTCPFFSPFRTKEGIAEEFNSNFDSLIESGDLGDIASKYPDVAALIWVLSEENTNDRSSDTDKEGQDTPDA